MGFKRRSPNPSDSFIASAPAERQAELVALDALIRRCAPKLAPSEAEGMLAYGLFHYRYASGREGDTHKIIVNCTKNGFSLHCLAADAEGYVAERFKPRFPKANVGKSCVRFKKLADLDAATLAELIRTTAASSWT